MCGCKISPLIEEIKNGLSSKLLPIASGFRLTLKYISKSWYLLLVRTLSMPRSCRYNPAMKGVNFKAQDVPDLPCIARCVGVLMNVDTGRALSICPA